MYTKGHGGKSRGMAVNVVYTKMHNAEGSARTVWVSNGKGEKEEKRKEVEEGDGKRLTHA